MALGFEVTWANGGMKSLAPTMISTIPARRTASTTAGVCNCASTPPETCPDTAKFVQTVLRRDWRWIMSAYMGRNG